jgi:hypothetical protein
VYQSSQKSRNAGGGGGKYELSKRQPSDKGKGQASSQHKAVDVVKRAARHVEQTYRGNKIQADKKSISSKESTSNPKESTIKPQKDRTSGLRERNFEMRWSSQKHRNAGQGRWRLRGGGDGEESTSKQQPTDEERWKKIEEETKDPNFAINRATDYLKGLNQEEYNHFNAYKHGYHTDLGEAIAKEHTRILNSD